MPCTSADDCSDNAVCDQGQCAGKPCNTSRDCSDGRRFTVCAHGACIEPPDQPVEYEDRTVKCAYPWWEVFNSRDRYVCVDRQGVTLLIAVGALAAVVVSAHV